MTMEESRASRSSSRRPHQRTGDRREDDSSVHRFGSRVGADVRVEHAGTGALRAARSVGIHEIPPGIVGRDLHRPPGNTQCAKYVEEGEQSGGALAFVSEAVENTPPGWRARESYIVHGPDEFEEVFELAQAGKPFEVYSRTRLKRLR